MSSGSGSGSSSRRSPTRGSNPALTPAVVAGANVDSPRQRRDRTRSRSPHLLTSRMGLANTNYSVAAQAAFDDTPRAGTSADSTLQYAPTNFKYSHILIKHKDCRRPLDIEEKPVTRTKDQAMDLIIDIHQRISRNLITFADAAVAFSECISARRAGDIQTQFICGRVQKSLYTAAMALAPGKISNVLETHSGYHILKRGETATRQIMWPMFFIFFIFTLMLVCAKMYLLCRHLLTSLL